MQSNLSDTNQTEEVKRYVPIDTIDQQVFVRRLSESNNTWDDIISYGLDNLYPNKAIETCNRSKSTKTATKTLAKFIKGEGWNDNTINETYFSDDFTGYDLLDFIAKEKSKVGFALHVNYNLAGLIAEIQPIDFENLRYKKTKNGLRLVWRYDWTKNWNTDEIIYNIFDPENVKNEIAEVGIDKYNGQIFYWTGTNKRYPLATFDEVYDEAQFQADQGVFKLRNIQNDYKPSGALIYPRVLKDDEEFKQAKQKISRGSNINDTGSIMFIGLTSDNEDMAKNIWTPFERNNVDKLFELQNTDAMKSIFASFQQPMILNGIETQGMFNQASYIDAFHFYNSVVEDDRKAVEKVFKKIFDSSIWNFSDVTIKPKEFLIDEVETQDEVIEETIIEETEE